MGERLPGTKYLYVKAQGDIVADADQRINLSDRDVLRIPGGTNPDPRAPDSSHQIYPISKVLAGYPFPCFELDTGTFRGFFTARTPATGLELNVHLDCNQIKGDAGSSVVPRPEERGLRPQDDRAFREVAAREQKTILVRDSNPAALNWIGRQGFLPKPMGLKAKTLRSGPFAGLVAADPTTSDECYERLGYRVLHDQDSVLEQKDRGARFFSDLDLHGVYDADGKDAWGPGIWTALNRALGGHLVKHGPQDDWELRNSPEAKSNQGPQVDGADGKAVTAYLPDGGRYT
jgi:hypothetical protein